MRIPVNVDFLFIDTEHTYEQVSREWAVYKRWLLDGAIVALDDIRMNDMPRFWNELQYEKLDLTEFCHPESGFGVFRVTQS
jgi:cephalosporin hydroxylase